MANLAKIKDICVYSAMTEHALECYEVKQLLIKNGVVFKDLYFGDINQHQETFNALSTWYWKGNVKLTFKRFPIIHWENCYDDYSHDMEAANCLEDFLNSTLMKNIDLAK